MASPSLKEISLNGLWHNNPALVQVLGLCPLLAMSSSVVNAVGMGVATIFVLTVSNTCISIIRNIVSDAIRLPVFVMIIAAVVTIIQLIMEAFTFELYQVLGVFLPLITTNCIILGRADGFACKHNVLHSSLDGFMMGLGYSTVMFGLGFFRELVGTGHVFADMHLLFGPIAANWKITPFENYPQFLYVVLPPGAFIFMGCFIACKNIINGQIDAIQAKKAAPKELESRRARVTGNIS